MSSDQTISSKLDRMLTLEMARVVESTAVAAAYKRGKGNEEDADQVAVDAMRRELNSVPISGRVVIGEGERDKAPMLYIGETVGLGGKEVDIALDPLEGTRVCAKNQPNALAVIALAERGNLLYAPDVYMAKIAVGPGYPKGIINLDASATDNLNAVAKVKNCPVSELSICVMDRPRHRQLIEEIRSANASVFLIGDGDVAGIIHTTDLQKKGIDLYMGIGGAPEGVLAAAALRCIGGQMQGRLLLDTTEKRSRAECMGIIDIEKVYSIEEMAKGDVLFAATGVTDGRMLKGVEFTEDGILTQTLVMSSSTRTVRWINSRHEYTSKSK
ncbi:class II fructose-bisphosphatase [Candidatus Endowatersipora endosymbiont of Watersipora subatra]|uniref:class II fructose-bisphosphatase n=1 Tax=Candidatus Endowatersipora endosymbiont of Watersipora subatra TaxID=3077946 RepID=UPI00312CAEB0